MSLNIFSPLIPLLIMWVAIYREMPIVHLKLESSSSCLRGKDAAQIARLGTSDCVLPKLFRLDFVNYVVFQDWTVGDHSWVFPAGHVEDDTASRWREDRQVCKTPAQYSVVLSKCHVWSFTLGVKKDKNDTTILTALFLKRIHSYTACLNFISSVSVVYQIVYPKTSRFYYKTNSGL